MIGIAFVAMKRNIHELQAVIKIGRRVGAKLFSVSNVMPYTEAMQDERLYTKVLRNIAYLSSPWLPTINLTKMDVDDTTREAFYQALNSGCNVTYAGNNFSGANDVCNFIESGTMSIAWDGGISPCWPLMHTHTSYLHGKTPHPPPHHWLCARTFTERFVAGCGSRVVPAKVAELCFRSVYVLRRLRP
jgi:MoaA/NifB/PqqE/SkfB family radical SAM enzyme